VGQNNLHKFLRWITKKTIWETKILFLDSETTTVLERISCKWWPLFVWCLRAERLGNCKTDRLTASMFSGVRKVHGRPHLFFRHTSHFPEVLNPQQNGFSVRYSVPRGDVAASTECTLHRYDRVTLRKVGFDGKCALLVGQHHLYDCGVLYRELPNYLHLSSPTPPFYGLPSLHNALLKVRRVFCPTLY